MQALHSSFTYISSEARRVAKPVIDTLAPIVPTFGCGEAEVKQSLGNCIHEMEADVISGYHENKLSISWSPSFVDIKKIVLYPLHDPAHFFGVNDKCHRTTDSEMGIWVNVTNNINLQLESWSIPFRFAVSEHLRNNYEILESEAENCVSGASKEKKMSLFFGHCDELKLNGTVVGGYQGKCHVAIRSGLPKSGYAHELAHIFSTHTFEAIPLTSLHPDVLEAMCDPVSHDNEFITSLSYWSKCRDAGFPHTQTHLANSRGQWGPIDLTMAKLATHKQRDATHAEIHADGVDKSYEWIRQNYGQRAAEQFVGSFVKSVFIHTMSAVVVRSITNKRLLRLSKLLIHAFGNLLHLGMMSQINLEPSLVIAQGMVGMGMMGRTGRALVDVIGDAALLRSLVQLLKGNSDHMLQMVYAICGTTAGNLFSQLIFGFMEMCAPIDAEQRTMYIEMTKPTSVTGLIMNEVVQCRLDYTKKSWSEVEAHIMSLPHKPIRTIINIDKAVADVIHTYVSLQAMTSWLWKKDQQQADAQVQASVDKLSATLGEVKSKFGPTDLPRVPSNTRSFGLTDPVPKLDLDDDLNDDPLLFMDGTAVTGISKASPSKRRVALTDPVPPLNLDRHTDDDDDPLLFTDGAAITGIGKASPTKKPQVWATKKQQ
jgi:hypothetical protein